MAQTQELVLNYETVPKMLLMESVLKKKYQKDFDVIRQDSVREISVHVTQHCNLRCKHCYAHVSKDSLANELSVADLQWIDTAFNPEKTVLLGGEPLLYPYLEDALKIFRHVTISTNGYYVKDHIDLLKEHNVILQFSIEGRERYNDFIRGKGTYQKVVEASLLAKKEGIRCYYRMGYCEENLGDIDWLLKNLSIPNDIPLALLARIDKPPMSIERQLYLFDLVLDANNDSLVEMPHFFQYLGKRGRCHAGSERLNFTYDKKITPCHLDWNYVLGEIGDDVSVINLNRQHFIKSCKYIKRECLMCPRSQICKGGCRVTNAHLGCPIKENFSIRSYAYNRENIDIGKLVDKVDRLVSLAKDAEIC